MNDIAGERIADTRAWQGAELDQSDWITQLSGEEISALCGMAGALPVDDAAWLDFNLSGVMD